MLSEEFGKQKQKTRINKKMKVPQRKKNAGMTLIEITLVIAILLSLIAVLFLGVAAYKRGADRAKCILNITTVQKTMRSYCNLNEVEIGDAFVIATIAGAGVPAKMLAVVPTCPATGVYSYPSATVPAASTSDADLFMVCSLNASDDHKPKNAVGW